MPATCRGRREVALRLAFGPAHALAVPFVTALSIACSAATAERTTPGASNAPRSASKVSAKPRGSVKLVAVELAGAWAPTTPELVLSTGHAPPRYLYETRVSPEQLDDYLDSGPATVLPAGTVIAMRHVERGLETAGPWYVMEKGAEGWQYAVADAQGTLAEQGSLPLCERCHAEAPGDHVFGPPRGAKGSPSGNADPGSLR